MIFFIGMHEHTNQIHTFMLISSNYQSQEKGWDSDPQP